ncbi:3'-5' exonuclease [Moelleriella libera RCEF 2490]|uniref:3'-5' exonuclease n=1 Tax=Moelleriella libera RCEF 2490 TaxID=1081109 RepID=A0A168APL4_9HYPO|nr:3'-5' exonuclease [Moelleriella libera RCEF 2490]
MVLVQVVNTVEDVAKVAEAIGPLHKEPPSLYVSLAGLRTDRFGVTAPKLSIYPFPAGPIFVVDMLQMKERAINTVGKCGTSLKDFLEGNGTKCFFDVRHDSNVLYCLYKIKLDGVQDIVLMELATRPRSGRFVSALWKCIKNDAQLFAAEKSAQVESKEKGLQVIDPNRGGSSNAFFGLHMRPALIDDCAKSVQSLPQLWKHYYSQLDREWRIKVAEQSMKRLEESWKDTFDGSRLDMVSGPSAWIE